MIKGIVFDLDGTLVDSLSGIACGLNQGIKELGYHQLPEEDVRKMVGRGARELCRSALQALTGKPANEDDPGIDSILGGFSKFYPSTWQGRTFPYEGIEKMLGSLSSSGYHLAVLSNKPHNVTVPLVASVFPNIPFDFVLGYSDQFPRKPDPTSLLHIVREWGLQPQEVCMVGDSAHDGNTGRNAGTQLLLVDWGYSDRLPLEAFGVSICDSASSLESSLRQL